MEANLTITESDRMRVILALGEAERHITSDPATSDRRFARDAVNDCQAMFGADAASTCNPGDAMARVRDVLEHLRHQSLSNKSSSQPGGNAGGSTNQLAAARTLEELHSLLDSFVAVTK